MSGWPFDGWVLPSWTAPVGATRTVPDGSAHGTPGTVRYPQPDPEWLGALASGLTVRRDSRAALTDVAARAGALGGVGRRFIDASDPLREEALARLPHTSGLSPAMAREVLDGMARDWTEERLLRLLDEELGRPAPLGTFVPRGGRKTMVVAPRLAVQLVAGSVPGVGVNALLRSLLVGSPTLLKPGLGDVVLPVLFARGLREAAPELADLLAVVYWPGGSEELERAAQASAEVVVAYGSDTTVAATRSRAPATARFVGYHHREGLGVVGADALSDEERARSTATDVAQAAALFDQRGCVSTRVVYVEDVGTPVTPSAFTEYLGDALAALEEALPSGDLEGRERSALHQMRGTAEMLSSGWDDHAEDRPRLRHGGAAPWTVFYDPYRAVETSCVGRVVVVRPFRTFEELYQRVAPVGPHLQTVGVSGLGDRLEDVARSLGRLGASRVTPFGAVPFPSPWWHHDGRGPLADLVRWVDLEREGGVDG